MNVSIVILQVAVFAVLLAFGAPVALALAGGTLLALAASGSTQQVVSLPLSMSGAADSYVLLAIPFFVLAGTILSGSAISDRLVRLARALTRRLPGGLGLAMIVAGLLLAGISGSGPADVAVLGAVLMPVLIRDGYPPGLASGLTALSGSIGIIVPPSIALIIFGSVAQGVSVERLFLGGVGPGICMALMLGIAVAILRPGKKGGDAHFREDAGDPDEASVGRAFLEAGWALLFPVIILGGIWFGIFTPTESAAVAVVYAVFVSGLIYRDLTFERLLECLIRAARVSAGVMLLVASAAAFARLLNYEGVAAFAADALRNGVTNRWLLLLGANVLILAAGCFLDPISVFYIMTPILLPALTSAGFDPVHLGLIFTVNLAIGQVTPPVGVNLFVSCELSGAGVGQTVRESRMLLAAALLALVIVNLVPALTLALPNGMASR